MSFKCSKVHFDNLTRGVKLSNNTMNDSLCHNPLTLYRYVSLTDEFVILELVTLMRL